MYKTYLYEIYAGIIALNDDEPIGSNNLYVVYDLNCKEYILLKEKYNLQQIADSGSDFQKAKNLVNHFSLRMTHDGNYDNHIECNSLSLLEYCLDNPQQGINCLNKAKILVEMCLACGIFARRVSIIPYSPYDTDNHVVIEIYENTLSKWIMLDPSINTYFIDENSEPLSMLEIRDKGARKEFCTAIKINKDLKNIYDTQKENKQINEYIMKNSFTIFIDAYNGFGHTDKRTICYTSNNYDIKKRNIKNWEYRIKVNTELEYVEYCKQQLALEKNWDYIYINRKQLSAEPR